MCSELGTLSDKTVSAPDESSDTCIHVHTAADKQTTEELNRELRKCKGVHCKIVFFERINLNR